MFNQSFGHLVSSQLLYKNQPSSQRSIRKVRLSQGSCTRHQATLKYTAISLVLLVSCMTTNVWAQTQNTAIQQSNLTLAQAIQHAQQYQSSQGAWQAQHSISEANIQQSRLWQNPSFTIEQTGFEQNKERELAIGISQRLDIFGERQARAQLATLAQSQMNLRQKSYQAQLELVIKYLWSQMDLAAFEAQLIGEQLNISQQTLNAAEKRYRAGAIAQVDVDRVRMTLLEDQRTLQQAEMQLQTAKQLLAQAWGEQQLGDKYRGNAVATFPAWSVQQLEQLQQNNLREQALRLDAQQSYAEMDYLKAKNRPNPTVSMGMTRTQSPDQANEAQLSVGLEIPLNLFDRQQYRVQIAQAKQRGVAEQQKFYQQRNQLEIQRLTQRLDALQQQFAQINQTQVPLAEQVQQKTLLGFEAGKLSVTDIQQAALQLQEIRLRKVQVLRDAWSDVIAVESLSLGVTPESIMAADALAQLNDALWQDTQNLAVIGE